MKEDKRNTKSASTDNQTHVSEQRDPALQELFGLAYQDLGGEQFELSIAKSTRALKRRKIMLRIALATTVAVIALPAKDYALALSEVLLTSLVPLEQGLIAELIAPINTVGALLSFVLLIIRGLHRRIFV